MTAGRKLDLEIDGKRYSVQVKSMDSDSATVMVDDRQVQVNIFMQDEESNKTATRSPSQTVTQKQDANPKASASRPLQKKISSQSAPSNTLQAVMPGIVIKVLASEGQQVKAGQILLVIEAMKMENEIRATKDATISKVLLGPGDKVQTGDSMITFV